jgi:hypothetical protein
MNNQRKVVLYIVALAIFTCGCSRVMVPPAIDLKTYEPVGIIVFKCNAEGNLEQFVTQRFVEHSTKDQKLVKFIQLDKEADVLKAVGKTSLDPDAIKLIAQKYNVKSVITGEVEISDVRPKINVVPGLWYVGAQADVEAKFVARMLEIDDGALIWTGSARAKRTVGHVSFMSGGHFSFDAQDPENAYGELVEELVNKATKDFRVTYHW